MTNHLTNPKNQTKHIQKTLNLKANFTMQLIRRHLSQYTQAKYTKGESLKVFVMFLLALSLFYSCQEKEPGIHAGGEAFTGPIQTGVEGLPNTVKATFLLEKPPDLNLTEVLRKKLSENNLNTLGLFFQEDSPLKEWNRIVLGVGPSSSPNGSSSSGEEDIELFVFLELPHEEKEIIRFFEDQWQTLNIENLKGFTSFTTPHRGFKIALLKRKFLLLSNQLESVLEVVRKEKSNIQTHSEFSLYQKELTTKNPLLWGIILTQTGDVKLPNTWKFLQQYEETVSSLLFSIIYKESDSLFEMELDTLNPTP